MTGLRSTGAIWLDVVLLGSSFLALPALFPLVLWTNPRQGLDPTFIATVLWFAAVGTGIVAVGVGLGWRTGWKIPDPKLPKVR